MKRFLFAIPVLALVMLIAFGAVRLSQGGKDRSELFTGRERAAPLLVLETPDGGELALESLRGQAYFVNLWATWCGPCELEHPVLMQMAQSGAPMIGILYKDEASKGQTAIAETGNPYALGLALDPTGSAGLDLGINSVPETFLIDHEGVIVRQHRGPVTPEVAQDLLSEWRELTLTVDQTPES